jgi:TatD DNase family protein
MIHSFAGSPETLQRLLRLGCFISFSARLTTDSKVRTCFLATPLANLLLETDAPAHPDRQPPRGSDDQNKPKMVCDEPAAITWLYKSAATMRVMTLNEFSQKIWENGKIFTNTIVPR